MRFVQVLFKSIVFIFKEYANTLLTYVQQRFEKYTHYKIIKYMGENIKFVKNWFDTKSEISYTVEGNSDEVVKSSEKEHEDVEMEEENYEENTDSSDMNTSEEDED